MYRWADSISPESVQHDVDLTEPSLERFTQSVASIDDCGDHGVLPESALACRLV